MADTVARMQPGSVIVDMAAETGGNCELTVPGEVITTPNGVTIVGLTNLPSTLPFHASQMYSKNLQNLLAIMLTKQGTLDMNFADDIIKGTTITMNGEVVHEATKNAMAPRS